MLTMWTVSAVWAGEISFRKFGRFPKGISARRADTADCAYSHSPVPAASSNWRNMNELHRLVLLCTFAAASTVAADEPRRLTLRGSVVDAKSGEAIASRIYIQGADGSWYFARSADPAGSAIAYDKRRPEFKSFEVHTTVSAHPFS